MDQDDFLALIALEFGIPVLEADDFGVCAITVNGHPVFLKKMHQAGVNCVLLSTAVGEIGLRDEVSLARILTGNLFAEGFQVGAVAGGMLVLNKVLALQALSRSQALDSIRRFGRHSEHWRAQLASEGAPNEHA